MHKTTVNPDMIPTAFIQQESFNFFRHPMYLEIVLLVFGEVVVSGSLNSFVSPFLFGVIINFKFITRGEKAMVKQFGKEYKNYQKKTGRLLPKLV